MQYVIKRCFTLTRGTFDQFLHSDITEQNLIDFEEQYKVPVLKIGNVNGPRLSDNRTLDGRAGITVRYLTTVCVVRNFIFHY